MTKDVKILMMGSGGTGKTCYMLAMYAAMSRSFKGYTFCTRDLDDDLELTDTWDALLQGTWPQGTEQSKDWAFTFNRGHRNIMGFAWHDYRGSVLKERSGEKDVQDFLDRARNASCIVLCIAGDQLAKYVDGGSEPDGAKRFGNLLNTVYRHRNGPVPVVIAITKADQCHSPTDDTPADTMERGIKKLQDELFSSLFVPGGDWLVLFVPVSLGTKLDTPDHPNPVGRIAPENVHIPVTFAIYCQLEQYIREKMKAMAAMKGAAGVKQQEVKRMEDGFWSSIFKQADIRSAKDRIEAIQKDLQLNEDEAEDFRQNLKRIQTELMGEQVHLYFNGREAKLKLE